MTLEIFLTGTRQQLEQSLERTFSDSASPYLRQAIHYSLLDGGKRLRPALVKAASELVRAPHERWLIPAQALEMVHVYSLIHDDLPAMDNDDLRRGKPTNHKQFNEATAILAGDALQTEAFSLITDASELTDRQVRQMLSLLAKSAGAAGMVGGQMLDLEAEQQQLNLQQLARLHSLKTGKLIDAALQLGALCTDSPDADVCEALSDYAHALGLAFQITDDILDITSSTEVLGKPQGSDLAAEKSTYVSLLGLSGAQAHAREQFERATTALQRMNLDSSSLLWQLAEYVIKRDH